MGSGPVDLHVLDTHVWIWLVSGPEETILESAVDTLRQAAAGRALAISAISVWEVGMLAAKGRLQLQMDCMEWVEQALERSGVLVLPLSPQIAVASSRLPGEVHGDPSDRIILATARHHEAVLVTRDRKLLDYAAQGLVRALEA